MIRVVNKPDWDKIKTTSMRAADRMIKQIGDIVLTGVKESSPVRTGRLRASHEMEYRNINAYRNIVNITASAPYAQYVKRRKNWVRQGVIFTLPSVRRKINQTRIVR